MAEYFSDNYTPDGIAQTSLPNPPIKIDSAKRAGDRYSAVCYADLNGINLANGDTLRCCTLRSSDRVIDIRLTTASWSSGDTMSLGVAEPGQNHDGPLIEDIVWISSLILTNNRNYESNFAEAAIMDQWDRGKALWELVSIGIVGGGGNALTSDPGVEYDILATFPIAGADGGYFNLIVDYLR